MKTISVVALLRALCFVLALTLCLFAQSTGGVQGTVADATGAVLPSASITVTNQATGEVHPAKTDTAGLYAVSGLAPGNYTVRVTVPGLQTTEAKNVIVSVGSNTVQNFSLNVAGTSTTVQISGSAPVIETSSTTVGAVINQRTVQEIPLNGRHFVDLALLIPGTVTPPANGFLTAPLRGQGSFSFNSAGAREDSVNFMVNGVNLNDPNQNQITFQPTINTVDEFKVDNSTFSAEYGRNSGSIVNIATRSGANTWHGEAYEFTRNSYFDARNFSNPTLVSTSSGLVPNKQSPFIRNQFGGDGGGAIKKDKAFIYLSYEALRQRQSVPLSSTTLSLAQRAQAVATSDQIVRNLLPLIPLPNSGTTQFAGAAVAPVNIQQGTANFNYSFSENNRLNVYYAIQRDQRNEPPSTDGNSFPGMGDQRNGQRQILTINDVQTISPTLVNESRIGFNRIHIVFAADNMDSAAAYGINSGVTAAIGLPQITVSGNFTFGGIGGFPQGRGDDVGVANDTATWVRGAHTIKFGGEFRRQNTDSFSYTPGTFTFPSVNAFLSDQATGFTANTSNRSSRVYGNSIGAFITDAWKIRPNLTINLGLRYDWYGTPTEAENRFVVFNPANNTLQNVGRNGGPSLAYNQSALNFEPRVGIAYSPRENGRTVIRSAFAMMTDQPTLGLVTGLATNPPYAFPISYASTTAVPFVTFANAFNAAGGSVAPVSIAHNYKDAYVSQWNFNLQQQVTESIGVTAGYVGSKGTHLNIERNYNQPINGLKPYPALSASSPIEPGVPLGSVIGVYESDGNSSYNGLWLTAEKHFSHGLQFNGSYTWSKSIDDNSRNVQGLTLQNSYNIAGDRGLSDFDARNRFVLNGIYDLPFHGNRFVEGWEFSLIETLQSGNPINFHLSNSSFAGAAVLRPNVFGPVNIGIAPATNGSPTTITYIQNPSDFVNQGTTPGTVLGFGNLGRNTIIGPGFADLDFTIVKNSKITERLTLQIRADAFDLLNQTNFTQPNSTVGSSTFGLITGGTRFPAGDSGSSRQLQLAMKLIF